VKRSEEIAEILGHSTSRAVTAPRQSWRGVATTPRGMSRCAPLASRRSAYLPGNGVDARVGEDGSEGCGELAGAVADEESEGGGTVGEVHQ
jgi:hypothetical protein